MSLLAFSEQPPTAQVHNLASLVNIDSKNINVEQLGADAIKEQQEINLSKSSNEVAIIPEDQAQTMLCGVSQFIFVDNAHS